MSEQVIDIRSILSTLRRRRWILVAAALVGMAAGVGFVVLRPPLYMSQSLVLLPAAPDSSTASTNTTQDASTEAQIAGSEVVLGPAGRSLEPPISARRLADSVTISAPTKNILQIRANSATAKSAEELAHAVGRAYLDYIHDAASSLSSSQKAELEGRQKTLRHNLAAVGKEIKQTKARMAVEGSTSRQGKTDAAAVAQLTAQQSSLALQIDQLKSQAASSQVNTGTTLIQDATPAKRRDLIRTYAVAGVAGLLLVLGVAIVFLVMFGQRDRRLRYRDEIADALGGVVIASVRSQVPRSVAGWSTLLGGYTPGTVDAWALRQALRHLLGSEAEIGAPRSSPRTTDRGPVTVALVALSDDLQGLAVGPQLASYAASVGVRTRLVAAQGHELAAGLWAACSGVYENSEIRDDLMIGTQIGSDEADLTLVLAVTDRQAPHLDEVPQAGTTVLAVSSGSATAEDLARAAVTADDSGMRIDGIIVADPDDLDRTTGRLLQSERSQQVPLPTHVTGRPAPSPTGATVSGLQSRRSR